RIMRERVGPGGDVLPRPAAPAVGDDVAAAADDAAPSLADEAEAVMAARRGDPARLPSGDDQLPLLPELDRVPTSAGARPPEAPWIPTAQPATRQGPLIPIPTPRPGAGGRPYGRTPPPAAPPPPRA